MTPLHYVLWHGRLNCHLGQLHAVLECHFRCPESHSHPPLVLLGGSMDTHIEFLPSGFGLAWPFNLLGSKPQDARSLPLSPVSNK